MKKIYDAVHGFIRLSRIEELVVDSEPFQRLHGIHQLGIAYLVYPGATHTRFEHSLGTMEIATQIFDTIIEKYHAGLKRELQLPLDCVSYFRQVIRLAALCHDLGHLPFSHVAEKALLEVGGHEAWTMKVIASAMLEPAFTALAQDFPGKDVVSDVIKMALGMEHLSKMGSALSFSPLERVMAQVVTGDFFGADRIDYLLRDAQCTGVSYGLFDYQQLIEMLCILETEEGLSLGIEENGISSCEALLLARYFMLQRVYQHPSVKGYTFHLSRFIRRFYEGGCYLDNLDGYMRVTDHEIITAIRLAKGDIDAEAILKRRPKFSVVSLPASLQNVEATLEQWQIPKEAVSLLSKLAKPQSFSFPVQLRSGKIVPGNHCSKIVIPTVSEQLLFVDAAYEKIVKEELSRC